MASKRNGTLYVGVTNNLTRRVYEHRNDLVEGFTKKYSVHSLVYYEQYHDIELAIKRERQMKKWNRQWKINRIHEQNPDWKDLYFEIGRSLVGLMIIQHGVLINLCMGSRNIVKSNPSNFLKYFFL